MNAALALCLALQSGIAWRNDFESARREAGERLLLLSFAAEGRPVVRMMEEETFRHPQVVAALATGFVPVRLDPVREAGLYRDVVGGRGAVGSAVLDASGDVVSVLGGYAGPREYLRYLQRAAAGYAGLEAARRAWAAGPESPEALYALGERYLELGSPKRAEECWTGVVDGGVAGSAAAASHARLARARVNRGRLDEARRHLEAARRLDAAGALDGMLLLTEGLALGLERKHAEAAALLDRALQRHPGHAEKDHVLYALGFVLHQDRQDARALRVLEGLIASHPGSAWVPAAREQAEHIRNPRPDHEH
jgi:tetratricopeptide (TPR) repeat protein